MANNAWLRDERNDDKEGEGAKWEKEEQEEENVKCRNFFDAKQTK